MYIIYTNTVQPGRAKYNIYFIGILLVIVGVKEFVVAVSTCGTIQVGANQQITVTNPGYSGNYAPGSSCMQVLKAPQGYTLQASCQINVYQVKAFKFVLWMHFILNMF